MTVWFAVLGILVLLGMIAVAFLGFNSLLDEILNSQLPWSKLEIFWKGRAALRPTDVTWVLRQLLQDAYSGEDGELKSHVSLLESYVDFSEAQDPLAGLPDDLRLPLETLVQDGKVCHLDLRPLLDSIEALVKKYHSKSLRKNWATVVSLVLAILSFGFAIYVYFNPVGS